MDRRTQKGYARIFRDLQLLELSDQLLTPQERAKASIDALEHLIHRLEQLGNDSEESES